MGAYLCASLKRFARDTFPLSKPLPAALPRSSPKRLNRGRPANGPDRSQSENQRPWSTWPSGWLKPERLTVL